MKGPESLTICSQVRQGIANNTKGTAFVVYEDVVDAKQACDKLNGFNFQNRYLVGKYTWFPLLRSAWRAHLELSLTSDSALPPARQDGPIKRGPRSPSGIFSSAQTTARYRLTIRPAFRQPAEKDNNLVCWPVFSHQILRFAGPEDDPAPRRPVQRRIATFVTASSRSLRRWTAPNAASVRLNIGSRVCSRSLMRSLMTCQRRVRSSSTV